MSAQNLDPQTIAEVYNVASGGAPSSMPAVLSMVAWRPFLTGVERLLRRAPNPEVQHAVDMARLVGLRLEVEAAIRGAVVMNYEDVKELTHSIATGGLGVMRQRLIDKGYSKDVVDEAIRTGAGVRLNSRWDRVSEAQYWETYREARDTVKRLLASWQAILRDRTHS